MSGSKIVECTDGPLRRIAHILGGQSGAARALAERDRRMVAGEDAAIYLDFGSGTYFVGPPIKSPPPTVNSGDKTR